MQIGGTPDLLVHLEEFCMTNVLMIKNAIMCNQVTIYFFVTFKKTSGCLSSHAYGYLIPFAAYIGEQMSGYESDIPMKSLE